MNTLFLALGIYAGVGGMQRFNQRVLRCLSQLQLSQSIRSAVVSLWDADKVLSSAPKDLALFGAGRSKVRTVVAFARCLHRMKPEVVLYGHVLLTPLALLAKVLSPRSQQLLFVHGDEVWGEPFRPSAPALERMLVRSLIDRVVSVSQFTVDAMKREYSLPAGIFRLLPNAVDVADGPSDHARPHFQRSEVWLLTVSRLNLDDRAKGCDNVILAMPEVLSRFPNVRYRIVGDGPLRSELEQLAVNVGVADRVMFLGHVSDECLHGVYADSDVFVMPSRKEGFGIVFLEAWLHCLPLVVGNKDASPEVVTHGVNGICVDPHSPEQFAQALCELLSDTRRAASMGQQGRKTVLERYTHDHFCLNLAKILAEYVGKPS